MTAKAYDRATLYHWLFWQLRCFKASPMEFQHLFEEVAKRAHTQFVPIKPYGKFGDRKADGLYFGGGKVFQVYAPDEMTRAKILKKIKEDLAGAVKEWGDDLKEWIFVYNARRGAPADVPKIVKAEARKYPGIAVSLLSNDALWAIVRELPVQDRVEILGPSPELEELFPLAATLPPDVQERLRTGKFVVVQDTLSPVNLQDALVAIAPAQAFGPPLYLPRRVTEMAWELAAEQQRTLVEDAIERSRGLLPRFAVFSLAPIPLAIHLGYLFSDRVEVEPFQFDRDRRTWAWDSTVTNPDVRFLVSGLPDAPNTAPVQVALRVSLSAHVTPEQTQATIGRLPIEVDLMVPDPDVTWLKHPAQLVAFAQEFRGALKAIREIAPNCEYIHIFLAGPTGAAVVAGQAINPRMNPPVVLYEYHRRKTPHYAAALTLR
jgi:hypothetical protein